MTFTVRKERSFSILANVHENKSISKCIKIKFKIASVPYDDPAKSTLSAFYHDDRGRVIQVCSSNQPYRYNGKELDRFQNLDKYDYGARHCDAALGRWLTVDPLAEKCYSISPYTY
ncbi:hypothetical protein KDN43_02535 [Proteiniphilum propionicum]|nr:hypothetical protein KDN43_02535 [Proteiniphilum propionicum]